MSKLKHNCNGLGIIGTSSGSNTFRGTDYKCDRCNGIGEAMTTEQELKKRCTPNIIKRMVELAEEFRIQDEQRIIFNNSFVTQNLIEIIYSKIFPLLIYRAVEGFNRNSFPPIHIYQDCCILENVIPKRYYFKNYQPQSLTQAECAMLHCLLDIFEEVLSE